MKDELLQQLADKLGTTVHKVYQVLIAQVHVELISVIMTILICVSLIASFSYVWHRSYKHYQDKYDAGGVVDLVGFISFSIILTSALVLFLSIGNIPTLLMNPDYWALQQILEVVR